MKKYRRLAATAIGVLTLMLGVSLHAVGAKEAENSEFDCFTYDGQGKLLDGYWSEEDNLWYLFVTSTQALEDVDLYFSGSVSEASAGTLDAENNVVSDAFAASGDQVDLTAEDGTVTSVVVMQSDLPSVYIDLEGTTLEEIHADKDAKHKGNSIYITDPAGEYDLIVEDSLEIKGRGNSTWREYEKKGYQIKFDSKTSVMGMGKAKKWVLLANASDDSMMRTQLVYRMAQNLGMDYVPSLEYVDLWIEGEYRGTYLIGEKVEIGSSRLDLSNDAGALFEHDEDFYLDEDYWFYTPVLDRHFTMKEIVTEEDAVIETAMADFEAALEELMIFLYSTPSEEVTLEALATMIDVDSFVKYYLINEYTLNRESFSTSFYWYQDGAEDVIHLGPIWDFDTCMGNDGEAYTESYGTQHVLFRSLMASPEFYARTLELLATYKADLESMTGNVEVIKAEIAASAEMNYLRWDVLGEPNPKGGADFFPTYDEAVEALHTWLAGREEAFAVEPCSIVTGVVSDDCYEMEISYQDDREYRNVVFGVWSDEGGQDDMLWYSAAQDADGVWRATADLGNHNSAGIYHIYAYANNEEILLATGRNYVETAQTPRYPIEVTISEDGQTLIVNLTDNTGNLTAARFAVWGVLTGQETSLRWLTAEQTGDGQWTVSSPLCKFDLNADDHVAVHAYGTENETENYLNNASVYVAGTVEHTYADGETGICSVCGYNPNEGKLATTPMYRLYNPNTGEHFYTGSEEERDNLVNVGWNYEGIAWHAPIYEGLPVYRVYNPNSGDHHYTMSQVEVDNLVEVGWQYEGVCWNSAPSGSPQYRLWNPNADLGSHHYTSSLEEMDTLVRLGWVLEGVGWFGVISNE